MAELGRIKPEDIVRCDVRGRVFYAVAGEKEGRELNIRPLPGQSVTFRKVTGGQVRQHWRLTKNT